MRFSWLRALPALIVAALMLLGLLATTRGVRARGGAEISALYYPRCDLLLQSGGVNGSLEIVASGGVTQPFSGGANVAACSLRMTRPISAVYAQMDVFHWDPATLAPDPTTVALRSRAFNNSDLMTNQVRFDFNPPLVTRILPHLADPRTGPLAMNYQPTSTTTPHTVYFDSDGAASTPIAYQYPTLGARQPLLGNHPVLSHTICGGDAALQNLFVAQAVMTTNYLIPNSYYELIQAFSVPTAISLRWVEFALGPTAGTVGPGMIAIVDAAGATTPPAHLGAALADATFYGPYDPGGHWATHYDFDQTIVLQPNHDYFLVLRTSFDYPLYARNYTGSESNDFFSGVGGLFYRLNPTGGWTPMSGRALSFRVIGEPTTPLDVPVAPPARGDLRLRIAPNPSRGTAFVNWSGASGAVQFDVLDARGRRIAAGRGEAGADGRWLWRGAHDDGRPLPAGVYFVRARDGAGHSATERVVLVP